MGGKCGVRGFGKAARSEPSFRAVTSRYEPLRAVSSSTLSVVSSATVLGLAAVSSRPEDMGKGKVTRVCVRGGLEREEEEQGEEGGPGGGGQGRDRCKDSF